MSTTKRAIILLMASATGLSLSTRAGAARRDLVEPGETRALTGAQAGNPVDLAIAFVRAHEAELGLVAGDLADVRVVDSYLSRHSGVTHVYLRQRLHGIELFNGDIAVHVGGDGSILRLSNRFVADLRRSLTTTAPRLDAAAALTAAARHLGLALTAPIVAGRTAAGPTKEVVFEPSGISLQPIPARLMYRERAEGDLRLAWNLNIYETDAENWWNLLVDAESGAILEQSNWVDRDSYRIYQLPARSPIHVSPQPPADGRKLLVDPADPVASPYGWHTTTVFPGQYRASRGNNVDAYDDQDSTHAPTGGDAARAVGTTTRDFDFALDHGQQPGSYVDAAITNLFYMNNVIHDILHPYGFDEASGNFQVNNYGRGGDGADDVQAEAQDGGGRNNANFATPPDGQRPRMQMYLWDAPTHESVLLTVNSPASIAGGYAAVTASFGPRVPLAPGITGGVIVVNDGSAAPANGCDPFVNAAEINGNFALADLGGCNVATKVVHAEAAGATALVVAHFLPGAGPLRLPGTTSPAIPIVVISYEDGQVIRAQTPTPGVNATLLDSDPLDPTTLDIDGDLDNEIVIHEYAHGVSNRLVGGRTNVDCLNNAEQAGEGWSDLLAIMLTVEPDDRSSEPRGVGTYALGQIPGGKGIRNYPYSTDMSISPLTYGDLGTQPNPHGTGAIWAAAGWEVFWAMTERYGFDPDVAHGNGGNNMAIQLIVDGLKYTPCSPGFVDDRDAVLMADQVATGGANACLLWQAFAKRGLGYSAAQGSADTVGDETEAFDLPPTCNCVAPVDLGNVLRAIQGQTNALDVELDFSGSSGSRWRLFRDPAKVSLRVTPLGPDATVTAFTDAGAVDAAAGALLHYRVTEADCLGNAGP